MTRVVRVGAAQLGPIERALSREAIVDRLVLLVRQAARRQCNLIVFPELALTPFFPRWDIHDSSELDRYYDKSMPSGVIVRLFEEAARLRIGFYLGYAEEAVVGQDLCRFNTSILVAGDGKVIGKYRKIHLPGHADARPGLPFQDLEKRYFRVGDLGFPVFEAFAGRIGMCICNDRRWPETYRIMGLKGVELIALGYNTPLLNPDEPQSPELRMFHNHLCMQAGAYQNSTWVVGVAKAGVEEGIAMMAGTCVISPTGEIVAEVQTLADELVVADCDLDACLPGKHAEFDFKRNRRPEHYLSLVEPV